MDVHNLMKLYEIRVSASMRDARMALLHTMHNWAQEGDAQIAATYNICKLFK